MGVQKHPMGSLWSDYQIPNPPTANPPLTFSQQLPNLPFLELFWPTAWARPKISQHNVMLTKIWESVTHTSKSLNLKYYHHTTPRSVNFLFSKLLLSNVPLEIRAFIFWKIIKIICIIPSFAGNPYSFRFLRL